MLLLAPFALGRGAGAAGGGAEVRHLYSQGSAAYDVGDFKEAIERFKAAYKLSPEPVFLFNIAQAYRQLKDADQALFFYRSFLRKAPADAASRTDAERWVRELQAHAATAPAAAPAPRTPPDAPHAAPARFIAGDGRESCSATPAAFTFEGSTDGFELNNEELTAFKSVAVERRRSWCGAASLRVETSFDLAGTRNKHGLLPNQGGQVIAKLAKHADLTGKTLTVHVFVDTSAKATFGAVAFAVNKGTWVNGKFFQPLTPGRWWTITASFAADNRLYGGGSSPVDDVDAIALEVNAIGPTAERTWSGAVYVDDFDWR